MLVGIYVSVFAITGDPVLLPIAVGDLPAHASTHTQGGSDKVTVDGIDAGTSATRTNENKLQTASHDIDCTALTDGVRGELCYEEDSQSLFICQPDAGDCNTKAEWIRVLGRQGFRNVRLREDFITSAGIGLGTNNWIVAISGGSSVAPINGELNHPGLIRLDSGITTGEIASFGGAGTPVGNLDADEDFDLIFIVRPNAVATTGSMFTFGLTNSFSSNAPTEFIGFKKRDTVAGWDFVTTTSSSSTTTASGVTASAATYYTMRVRQKNPTTIAFSIDGGSETDHTANIPGGALGVGMMSQTSDTTATKLDVDLIFFDINGLSR